MSISSASRKRAAKRARRLKEQLEQSDKRSCEELIRGLFEQWDRQARFRAAAIFLRASDCHQDGNPIPRVWDLYHKKLAEAKVLEEVQVQLGVEPDATRQLAEICRQAVARHMGRGMAWLGRPMHPAGRRPAE